MPTTDIHMHANAQRVKVTVDNDPTSLTLQIMRTIRGDNNLFDVAESGVYLYFDRLDTIEDIGYEIIKQVRALKGQAAEPIDFGESLEANIPIDAVNSHAERIAEQGPAPLQHPIGERFVREAEQTI